MTHFNSLRWIVLGICLTCSWRGVHAQVITSFSPQYGSAGDSVTIIGSGFTAATTVRFWNNKVAMRFVNSSTTITATVPSDISTGPISVQNSGGGQNYSGDVFALIDPWAFVERVEPLFGSVGDTVLIYGAHFGTTPVVKFGGVTASASADASGTLITAFVPVGAPSNSVVTVTALGGSSTNDEPFTVVGPEPFVAGFAPNAGSASTPVNLVGVNFTGTSSVLFNGQTASFNPPTSDTLLQAFAPSGVTTGPITVGNASGSYVTPTLFYGPISISGFSPSSGPTGTEIVINGTNFTDATSVRFGGFTGVEASFVVSNNNQIVATVPDDAPTGILVVATPAGSFPTTTNFVVTPSITGFTPQSGALGTPVLITGTRLVDNSGTAPTVTFDGVPATVNSWSSDQVLAIAPDAASGIITLITADGADSTVSLFYYPPQITSFTPNADPPGSIVTITGDSLTNTSSVLFNGVPSTNVTVINNTTLLAEVPVGVATGPLTVTTPGGSVNSAQFYFAVPIITAFAPNSGRPGTNVIVFGSNFEGTTSVKFNGVEASFSGVSGGQLTAVVPTGASTGPITVTAPAGTAVSGDVFVVPIFADLRVNTFLHSPEPVTVGADLTLTIEPTNDGPDTASNVTASVTVGPGLLVKSASSDTAGITVNTNGNPVVFDIGTLITAASTNPTLTLVLVPQVAGSATNTVTLGSSSFDPDSGNNTASIVSTVVPVAELSIEGVGPDQVRVAWPASLESFVLQSTLALTNGSPWADVATPPVIQGDEQVVTEPSTGATKFYRLKQ